MATKKKQNNPMQALEDLYKDVQDDIAPETAEQGDENSNQEDSSLADIIKSEHKRRRSRTLLVSLVALIILAGASVSGFLYFSKIKNNPEENIKIKIEGPEKVAIKEDVSYTLSIQNKGTVKTKENKINLLKPNGFEIIETIPEKNNHVWDLGSLSPFETKTLEIKGFFIDEASTTQTLKVTLSFVPENFHSDFTKTEEYKIELQPYDLVLNTDSPHSINQAEVATLKIHYVNDEKETSLDKVKIKVIPTSNLKILAKRPAGEEDENSWVVNNLEPNHDGNVEIDFSTKDGFVFDAETEDQKIKIQILQGNKDDEFFLVKEEEVEVTIAEQELTSYLIINGSSKEQVLDFGDTLNFSVVYKNKGAETYSNVEIRTYFGMLPVDLLDWKKLDDANFGKLVSTEFGKELIWTKDEIEDLELIGAKEDGMINFSIPVKTMAELDGASLQELQNASVSAQNAIFLKNNADEVTNTISSNKITNPFNTDLDFAAKALFFYDDGTPIGSGPIPPKVGQETKYKIFLDIENSLHELGSVEVAVVLPKNVSLTDEYFKNVGEVDFNGNTREVTWKIKSLPTSITATQASFSVAITPTEDDLGKLIHLTKNIEFSAKDKKTDKQLFVSQPSLTTNLDFDEYGKGNGSVTK